MLTLTADLKTRLMLALDAVVIGNLDDAFANFRRNPAGPHWEALENAMWAAQYIKQSSHREWIVENLMHAGIGTWMDTIVKEAKKDRPWKPPGVGTAKT